MKKETGFLKGFFGGLTLYEVLKFLTYLTGCLFGYKGTISVMDCFILAICGLCSIYLCIRDMPKGPEEDME